LIVIESKNTVFLGVSVFRCDWHACCFNALPEQNNLKTGEAIMFAENKITNRFEFNAQPATEQTCDTTFQMVLEDLEIFSCWRFQQSDRYGAGTAAPYIPTSQRQYDGDNHFDYCEIWLG
jgi:hypothetical protein